MFDLREQHHLHCVVCSPNCAHGLQLCFTLDHEGVAVGSFACDRRYEGYPGLLHGGIISALLDGAMTNCLFLHGIVAVTAELNVRFRHPVLLNQSVQIRAWIIVNDPPVFRLQAELAQEGIVKSIARAAFMLPKSLPQSIQVELA